jgi:hypothetical protein
MDELARFLFGWPAVLISLGLVIAGIQTRRVLLVVLAAILLTPFARYLGGAPGVGWLALGLPFCLLASAYALYRNKNTLAWLCNLPVLVVCVWLAIKVIAQ